MKNLSEAETKRIDEIAEWAKIPQKEIRVKIVEVLKSHQDTMIELGITPRAVIVSVIYDLIGSNAWDDETFDAFLQVLKRTNFFTDLIKMLEEDGRITPGKHKAPLII